MSRVRWLILIFLVAPAAVVRAQAIAAPMPETKAETRLELERQTFALVNDYRHEHGLPPLAWNATIAATARVHSRDMAEGRCDFGHDGFSDRVRHLREVLGPLRGGGENVLETDDPNEVARTAVTLWLHSPAHLHNIRGDFDSSGLGIWQSEQGVIYFTQIFVKLAPPAGPQNP